MENMLIPAPARRRGPFAVAIAAVVVVALTFAMVAFANHRSSAPSPRPPVTLEAALAAFGGATTLYLKLPGIDGGSTNARHQKEIEVADFSWGLTNPNGTPTAATATDVTVTKGIDIASPKLFGAAAAGTTFYIASIIAERGGSTPFAFATLNLLAPRVVSINQVANTSAGFDEKITLRATAIQLVYTVQKPDGTAGTPVTSCWNLTTHAAC